MQVTLIPKSNTADTHIYKGEGNAKILQTFTVHPGINLQGVTQFRAPENSNFPIKLSIGDSGVSLCFQLSWCKCNNFNEVTHFRFMRAGISLVSPCA